MRRRSRDLEKMLVNSPSSGRPPRSFRMSTLGIYKADERVKARRP
jgi:hypothetical protein